MPTQNASVPELERFFISTYLRPNPSGSDLPNVGVLLTPLLDPQSLETAVVAYDNALDVLRMRAKAALRPTTRHVLANMILSFVTLGERDPRSLADRALAYFP